MGAAERDSFSDWKAASSPGKHSKVFFLRRKSGQRLCNVGETGDKPSVVGKQAQKVLYSCVFLGVGNSASRVRSYSFWQQNMTHAPYFLLNELALSGFSFR
jgi:hypothetical protein